MKIMKTEVKYWIKVGVLLSATLSLFFALCPLAPNKYILMVYMLNLFMLGLAILHIMELIR